MFESFRIFKGSKQDIDQWQVGIIVLVYVFGMMFSPIFGFQTTQANNGRGPDSV